MERFVSDVLTVEAIRDGRALSRADLVFYGVDHGGPSYEARVFLNNTEAGLDTPLDQQNGYAGSFTVFGHGGCFGDEGHCDPTDRVTDEFDFRLSHPLTPHTKTVIVTEELAAVASGEVRVTVVPVVPGEDRAESTDALAFDHIRIVTYETP